MAQATSQRSWLDRLWAGVFARAPSGEMTGPERACALATALLSERGEASGAALSRELTLCLQAMGSQDRLNVLHMIGEGFAPDPANLRAAIEDYVATPTPDTIARLHEAAEPPRQELLRRMNMAPGGTSLLVALRRELLGHLKTDPDLRPLDHDLLHLFSSWFNRGFLELRRIDWQTSAAILEKLITYEAVHEIEGWPDLRRRLLPDRRCFAFFHHALPTEPLIFVEVALTNGLSDAVQPLLAQPENEAGCSASDADSAIFYSISNCQEGLRGVSFGNLLVKQVVEELKAELPQLKSFATLSPMPGFAAWLQAELSTDRPPLTAEDIGGLPQQSLAEAFAQLTTGQWWEDPARTVLLRAPVMRAAALYLTRAAQGGTRIDPVARFHLGNGARLERIDWLGNISARGMRESCGIMVNYLYDPATIEANHEAFVNTGHIVRSSSVDGLATGRRTKQAGAKAA